MKTNMYKKPRRKFVALCLPGIRGGHCHTSVHEVWVHGETLRSYYRNCNGSEHVDEEPLRADRKEAKGRKYFDDRGAATKYLAKLAKQ